MKRKGWVRLLSCAVALMLPIGALAQSAAIDLLKDAKATGKEIVTTVTFEPGAVLAADKIVSDLSAATSIRLNKLPGGYGALSVALSGVDVVSAQLRVGADGLYVQSETLGEKPLYFSWEDLNKGMQEAMKSSGASQPGMEQFGSGFMSGIQQAMTASATAGEDSMPMTEEEIKQRMIAAMGGDESFVNWISAIEARKVVTSGSFSVEGSDAADTKTELTLTANDLVSLFDVPFIQQKITEQLKANDSTLTDEQAATKTAEAVAAAKEKILASDMSMPIAIYTIGEEEIVALEMSMTGNFTKDGDSVTMGTDTTATQNAETVKTAANLLFTRTTTGEDKLYQFSMDASGNDKPVFGMKGTVNVNAQKLTSTLTVSDESAAPVIQLNLTCDYTDAKHVTGEFDAATLSADSPMAVVLGFDQTVGDASVDTALSLASGTDVASIQAAGDSAVLGTLKVNMLVQEDSGFFSSLKEADPSTSVELMKMSDTDMQTYVGTLQTNAMQTLYKVFGNLPASVSSELSGLMSGN